MSEFVRCVGGIHDGQFLTIEEFHKVEDTYERMPIFAPSPDSSGFRFTVFKCREIGYADVVLRLLNGYCPEVIPNGPDAEDAFSDLFGDSGDDDWSAGEASEESNGPW